MPLMENWIVLKKNQNKKKPLRQELLDQMFFSIYVVPCKQCISLLAASYLASAYLCLYPSRTE